MTITSQTPQPRAAHCPTCKSVGTKVKRRTLEALLLAPAGSSITDSQYRFCATLDCPTAYFAEDGSTFAKADLGVRVGVKERSAPRHVCYCFDHTIEEINAEVRKTGQSTVLADIKERMKTACWCEKVNPQGSCCLGTVRHYVQLALVEQGHPVATDALDDEPTDCCAPGAHPPPPGEDERAGTDDCCSPTNPSDALQSTSQRKGILAVWGALLSALAASACCWIPFLLITFGVSAGGVAAWFEQYRWPFLGLTVILLGTGFYFVYFRKPSCAQGSTCAASRRTLQPFNRFTIWVATAVVVATAAFPKYVSYLIPTQSQSQVGDPVGTPIAVTFDIEGMTCEACTAIAKNALVNVDGVLSVEISYAESNAVITIDEAAPPSAEALAEALESVGYEADTSLFLRDGSG